MGHSVRLSAVRHITLLFILLCSLFFVVYSSDAFGSDLTSWHALHQMFRSVVLCALVAAAVTAASVSPLPVFNADIHQTTVGGLSSGAFFAVQMHVTYSSFIRGAAVYAGGPYDCESSQLFLAYFRLILTVFSCFFGTCRRSELVGNGWYVCFSLIFFCFEAD
jgi:hypothetical protein